MKYSVIATALVAALAAAPAVAQDTAGSTAATPAGGAGISAMSGATTSTMSATAGSGQVSEADKEFAMKAGVGGLFEVQSSQLAATRAKDDSVKQFAQQMITDHTRANQELMTLAQQKGITLPQALDEKHQKQMEKLQSASDDFDKAYGQAQARAHNQAVQLFTKASQGAQDPDLKAFAAKTLPKLKEHQQMAKQLPGADEVGKKKDKDKAKESE